jgi:UDP-N-acetyl-2-amino-2-deoxyglucuronate dehydrogenase
MKYALIGCGRISINHFVSAKENNLDIIGLCDIVPDNIDLMLDKADDSTDYNKYADYTELLREQKPELVAIATESGNHAQIAIDCIEAGCSVIIEKPIALSLKDADAIIKAGEKNNVVVCACHQNRFNKAVQIMKQAIDNGRMGKLLHSAAHIRWNRNQDYYTQAPWRGTWEQDGGALMNQCIHNIDLIRWMMGDNIDEVFAYTDKLSHDYIDAEDLGVAVLKFSNGAYGLIEGTTNVFPSNLEETLYIFGQTGTIKAGGKSVNLIEEWNFSDDVDNAEEVKAESEEHPPNVYGFGHSKLYTDVLDCIKTGKTPLIDGHAGKRALELVLAIYKSSKDGVPVKLPLKDYSTMDLKGFFDE